MIFKPRKVKRILMVGVLDVPGSTNIFMAKGFKALGYFVEAYNYRTKAKECGSIFAMWDDFKKFLIDRDYELIVFCKANQMHPELLSEASEVAPTWYWFMDPMETAKAVNAVEMAKYATFASATSTHVKELFKTVNDRSYFIIEGYDPDMYFYEKEEKKYDISFVGHATEKRVNDLFEIMKTQKVNIFGNEWPPEFRAEPPIFEADERRVFNQSKIVLNLVQDGTIFSDRVVKALGCGATVVSQECKDLMSMFIAMRGGHVTSIVPRFEDVETLSFLHKLYTKEEVPEMARLNIAKYMKTYYSWKATCIKIMDKVEGNYG